MKNAPTPRFVARTIERIPHGAAWDTQRIGVFQVAADETETQVGTYEYWYHAGLPFMAFRQGDRDYALYADSYDSTKVLSLPDCQQVAAESDADRGFCPVEFYVPTIENGAFPLMGEPYVSSTEIRSDGCSWGAYWQAQDDQARAISGTIGFVAGCFWGDDRTWKIEVLDLSQITTGRVKRDQRFGYLTLPPEMKLAEVIDCEDLVDVGMIRITTQQAFDWKSGNPLEI